MTRILYLHGFASGPASSKARSFAAHFASLGVSIEIPDLAAGDFEHLTLSGQLGVITRAAAGEPVSIIGSSMGGYLAALYAARHREVRRLVLLAPAFGFARRWPEVLGAAAVDDWQRTGTREVFHYGEGRTRNLHYGLLEDGLQYEEYPAVTQPTLIFHGKHDDVVPAEGSEHFAKTHSKVRLEVLNSGHELHNVINYMTVTASAFLLDA